MATRRWRIPGDAVNRATSDLQDDQRSAIRWLHAHCAEHDLSLDDAGKLIRYDPSTVYRLMHGKYEGNLDNVCREIQSARRLIEERHKGRRIGFIVTALARKIWRVCDAALEFQRIAFIIGESQIGKTAAVLKYRDDHNHGSTVYVRVATGGGIAYLLADLAVALRFSPQQKEKELRRRVIDSFDDRMLLIVDEVHQCVISSRGQSVRTVEFIRELHDATACGVVLCGTQIFDREIETGRFAGILKQTNRRRLVKLRLPDLPSRKDLDTFAAAYDLPPAEDADLALQSAVLRDEALGMWLCLLRMAAKLASRDAKKLTWAHVHRAWAGLRSLEN
jgi:DNA transposition AAA+ family ATPase